MKKCKFLRDEKCVSCKLCEPIIELTREKAETKYFGEFIREKTQ